MYIIWIIAIIMIVLIVIVVYSIRQVRRHIVHTLVGGWGQHEGLDALDYFKIRNGNAGKLGTYPILSVLGNGTRHIKAPVTRMATFWSDFLSWKLIDITIKRLF